MSASVLREARGLVATLIGDQPPGSRLKAAFPRVARFVGLSERRIRAIWHSEARAIRADEMDALREAAARKSTANVAFRDAARLETAATALAQIDPEFHRGEIERLRLLAHHLRSAVSDVGERR